MLKLADLIVSFEPRGERRHRAYLLLSGELVDLPFPSIRGLAWHRGTLLIAAPGSVYRLNAELETVAMYRREWWRELHDIAVSGDVLTVVVTKKNQVEEYDLRSGNGSVIYQGWSGTHLNTIHDGVLTVLRGFAVDLGSKEIVWELGRKSRCHDYCRLHTGYVVLSENQVLYNGEVVHEERGRFFRGLCVDEFPIVWLGVSTFMERGQGREEYKPPELIRFDLEKREVLDRYPFNLEYPWCVYDIIPKHADFSRMGG